MAKVWLCCLQLWCVWAEVLDPRECRFVFVKAEEAVSDWDMILRRLYELQDGPPLADHQRFPSYSIAQEWLVFNRAYMRHLDEKQRTAPSDELTVVRRETESLYQVWDCVRDSQCPWYYVTVRRQALKRLHDLIGEDDYRAATLPNAVPLHRFVER